MSERGEPPRRLAAAVILAAAALVVSGCSNANSETADEDSGARTPTDTNAVDLAEVSKEVGAAGAGGNRDAGAPGYMSKRDGSVDGVLLDEAGRVDGNAKDGAEKDPDRPGSGPWRACGAGREVPTGAFAAGAEGATTFYACRAQHAGGLQGGKAFPLGNCNFGWGGRELMVASYEVLVGASFVWQASDGPLTAIPLEAVVSGQETSGATSYVCRAAFQGGTHPGKLVAGRCNIGFGGQEIVSEIFDILLMMAPAKAKASPSARSAPPGDVSHSMAADVRFRTR